MEHSSIYENLKKEPDLMNWVETQAASFGLSVEEFAVSVLRSAFAAEKVIKGKERMFGKFPIIGK